MEVWDWFLHILSGKRLKKNNSNSDIIIVKKIKEGDTSEFRVLVDKYKDVSFSLACSILRNEHEAEDALQESFLKAFHNIRKFNNKSSFSTWFYRIVVNTCFTLANKQRTAKFEDISSFNTNLETSEENTGYDKLVASDRKKIIDSALKRIKSDEALLLQLYYLSELDVKEIKEVTGFKESKIKVTLHRARISLRHHLQKALADELILIK